MLKVLTTQVLVQAAAQPSVYRSLVKLLNNALKGSTLILDSRQSLHVGSLLSVQFQVAHILNFALPDVVAERERRRQPEDLLRPAAGAILHLQRHQLASWEKNSLNPNGERL